MFVTGHNPLACRRSVIHDFPRSPGPFDALVLGASAGGVLALGDLLACLPDSLPVPIAIVQHCQPQGRSFLPEILTRRSPLPVRHAQAGDILRAGRVYLAPPGLHLLVTSQRRIMLAGTARVCFSRPSVDVLFQSAAEAFGERTLGVVLTGANQDGAQGTRRIRAVGGLVIAQEDARFATMPGAAIATGCVDYVLPLEKIAAAIIALCMVPGAAAWLRQPERLAA